MRLQDNLIITALIYKDSNKYIVQGLEHDIKLSGFYSSIEAKSKFLEAISKQVVVDLSCGLIPLTYYEQAKKEYFEQAISAKQSGPELPVYLPIRREPKKPHLRVAVRFLEISENGDDSH